MLQFTQKQFRFDSESTVGVEMGTRNITLEDKEVKLEIWDTAGQESFLAITRSYYRGADGCLLVYDISRRKTFTALSMWLSEARAHSNNPNLVVMMIGNKADLQDKRQVPREEAEEFAEANGLIFLELSAKNHQEVQQAFLQTAESILRVGKEHGRAIQNGIKLGNTEMKPVKSSGGGCC
jgi:Ras-related protein Rab-2A